MTLITCNKLYKEYHKFETSGKLSFRRHSKSFYAVSDITLEVNEGEILGLIGLNGSGKTTLLKLLLGLVRPSKGEIIISGHIPHKHSNVFYKEVGAVFASKNQLEWDLTPYDTYKLNKVIYDVTSEDFETRLDMLSKGLNCKNLIHTPVRMLSLGEKMKCEIIASLLHNPKFLVLDEPTIGLDIETKVFLRKFIKEYCAQNKITAIITSHEVEDILKVCTRAIILNKGKLQYDLQADEFKNILSSTINVDCVLKNCENQLIENIMKEYDVENYSINDLELKFSMHHSLVPDVTCKLFKNGCIDTYSLAHKTVEEELNIILQNNTKEANVL